MIDWIYEKKEKDMTIARMLFVMVVMVGLSQVAKSQEPSQRDRLRLAVQAICPVSGDKLGEHGLPIKVKVGKEEVFLCCKGCLQGKVDAKHWATIHTNFSRAQGKCPVMNNPLPKNPKSTIVEGQIIYVCCPPCTQKIAADPIGYLRKMDELYTTSLQARRDAP